MTASPPIALGRRHVPAARTAASQATYAAGLALVGPGGSAATEAVAVLDESAALAAAAGNRWMEAFALTEAMWLRSRRGETDGGARAATGGWWRPGSRAATGPTSG